VHIVLTRAGRNQLKHMREQQRIAVGNFQLTGNENQHCRAVHAELDILCKHGNVVSYLPQALKVQEMVACSE
jgi:deoxycytidylate deaminase